MIQITGRTFLCACVLLVVQGVPRQASPKKNRPGGNDLYAICEMRPNPSKPFSNITGTILFHQTMIFQSRRGFLSIQVNIENIPTDSKTGRHGFHVHQYGDMSDGCESMGSHYNPFEINHGAPWDLARHVGDLGNVIHYGQNISMRLVDYQASLTGKYSIIGRGIVLHAGTDDLGRADNPGSKATGNAGGRLACCTIAHSKPQSMSFFNLYK